MRTNFLLLTVALLGLMPMNYTHAADNTKTETKPHGGGVYLYSPYTKIAVAPGATIDYKVSLVNNSPGMINTGLSLRGIPRTWKYEMKSGGWSISKLAVLPKDKQEFDLTVNVPLQINKGSYTFYVSSGYGSLPLTVIVSQQGTYQTEFTTDQPNMQGNSKSTFTFSALLKNQTADKQLYALMANAPRGWNVVFKPNFKQATSAQVEPNSSQSVSIEITPPANVEAGNYKIPTRAVAGNTSANLDLEVVVTGSYQMELTTPQGLLSAEVTAGSEKRIELEIRNTGSSILKDIQLSANKPSDWEVSFEPTRIDMIKAGEMRPVTAILKASKKALPGDYVTSIEAKTPEVNAAAQFRITVKTSVLWGWTGILIIIVAIGGVYYLFRKYGRR